MERKLRAFLTRKGVPVTVVDDVVQDVAEAALVQRVPYSSGDDLLRWARVVAQRKVWRELRRVSRTDFFDEFPNLPAADRVEDTAIARRRLQVTLSATERLATRHREALTTPAPAGTKRVRDRHALRLHRARKKLEELARRYGLGVACRRWDLSRLDSTQVALGAACLLSLIAPASFGGVATDGKDTLPASPAAPEISGARPDLPEPIDVIGSGPERVPSPPRVDQRRERVESQLVSVPIGGDNVDAGTADNDGTRPLVCYSGPELPSETCVDVDVSRVTRPEQ